MCIIAGNFYCVRVAIGSWISTNHLNETYFLISFTVVCLGVFLILLASSFQFRFIIDSGLSLYSGIILYIIGYLFYESIIEASSSILESEGGGTGFGGVHVGNIDDFSLIFDTARVASIIFVALGIVFFVLWLYVKNKQKKPVPNV